MLRFMRRAAVWFLIAVLWLVIAVLTAVRHGWPQAWLQALVAILFFGLGGYFLRKDGIR